tara:strand:+ start:406 stop:1263 length:858 start_codon:yes stop_codon:yes gene_type:complete
MKKDIVKSPTLIISPDHKWFDFHLKEIWNYRDLLVLFVKRDILTVYKQTILGPLWFLIQPLISTIVFSFIFNKIAKISTDNIPPYLFYMSGLIAWNYFSDCFLTTSRTFTANASIFGKVYFPRIIIPLSKIVSGLVKLFVQLIMFFMFYFYYTFLGYEGVFVLNIIIILPFLILQMGILGLGLGMIISSLTTKYRDLSYLVAFGTQLLMYASPIVYPLSYVPEKYKYFIILNPLTPIIEGFRQGLVGSGQLDFNMLFYSICTTIIIFFFGLLFFNKIEKKFMDTV